MDIAAASSLASTGRQLGRYFSMLNGLSSLIVVGIPIVLVLAGAPGHAPDLAEAMKTLGNASFVQLAAVGIAAYSLAFVLHPLQFAATQLLEGYWGVNRWSQQAMIRSTRLKLAKWYRLHDLIDEADTAADSMDVRIESLRAGVDRAAFRRLSRPLIEARVPFIASGQEARRVAASLPDRTEDFMPTDLGNVLRRFERLAGQPFGLEGVTAVPYLAQVSGANELGYLDDSRSALDLAVRMVVVWSLSTIATLALLWPHGSWILVPLTTFCLAWLSYRGSVAAAARYGNALVVVTALGRDDLYQRMGVARPKNTVQERALNLELNRVLSGYPGSLRYAPRPSNVTKKLEPDQP